MPIGVRSGSPVRALQSPPPSLQGSNSGWCLRKIAAKCRLFRTLDSLYDRLRCGKYSIVIPCLCVENFRSSESWRLVRRLGAGSSVRALLSLPPSLWVGALARIVAFIALECGLCLAWRVSSRISGKQEGLFARPVSASENSVPRSGGDWFDDCVLGSEYGGKRPVSAIRD